MKKFCHVPAALRHGLSLSLMLAGLAEPVRAQLVATSQVRVVTADAHAYDGEINNTPLQQAASAPGFALFQQGVNNFASQADAVASSQAGQRSEILPYTISASGTVFASAAIMLGSQTASAGAQSVADINLVVTNAQAWSMSGALSGSISAGGTLVAQVVLRDLATGSNLFIRSLPADAGAFSGSGALRAGSYKFLAEFRDTPATAGSGSPSQSGNASYRALLRVAPAPLLTLVARDTNNATVAAWQSVSGATYQVEFADSPLSATWSNLGATVAASNASATARDTNAPAASRAYRVYPLP
jgi:hypothetical protein